MKQLLITGFLFGLITLTVLSCQKELSEESNTNNATFSLLDSNNQCLSAPVVNGNYYNGVTAALGGNFVTIVVDVKSTGNYVVSTDSSNGFSFFDSGFFSKTGLDTLVLLPRGKPILVDSTDFSFSPSSCPFTVPVQDSTGTGLGGVDTSGSGGGGSFSANYKDDNPADDGTWHFTDSTNKKTFGGNYVIGGQFADNGDGTSIFQCQGIDKDNSNLYFTISLEIPGTSVKTGSYKVDGIATRLFLTNINTPLTNDYDADASTTKEDADPSYINITSYDETTKRIKGSFRCWAVDANQNPVLIKGSFNVVITF